MAEIEVTRVSPNTVTAFYRHFRQLVSSTLDLEDSVIGGPNVVVEVDETKLGMRKYHRGHRVEGVWVVVGVEQIQARRVFLVPVEAPDRKMLASIIRQHVVTGLVFNTDLLRGYMGIEEHGNFIHQTINHSKFFRDLETGVHTNRFKGTNSGIKARIPVRSRVREGMEKHLGKFVWRQKHEGVDLWGKCIEAIQDIHYDI